MLETSQRNASSRRIQWYSVQFRSLQWTYNHKNPWVTTMTRTPLGYALGHIRRSDEFHAAGCCESLCPNLGNGKSQGHRLIHGHPAIIICCDQKSQNIGNPHARAWPTAESNMVQRLMGPESWENFRDSQIILELRTSSYWNRFRIFGHEKSKPTRLKTNKSFALPLPQDV